MGTKHRVRLSGPFITCDEPAKALQTISLPNCSFFFACVEIIYLAINVLLNSLEQKKEVLAENETTP